MELLESFDEIGPSNTSRRENREARPKGIEEQQNNRHVSHTTEQPLWRTQSSGNYQNKIGKLNTLWQHHGKTMHMGVQQTEQEDTKNKVETEIRPHATGR